MEELTLKEAAQRLEKYGLNIIEGKKRTPLFFQFLSQFKDTMVIILIVAAIFAYSVGETVDATIIIGIVILNAAIGFAQEFKAERAIEALKKLLAPKARVLREGTEMMIDASKLVPGDVIILSEGDKVSADCDLFEENEINIDESVLTGESVPVKKDIKENKSLFMGTQITHGSGKAVVVKTGMRTQFGRIAALTTETKKDKSPLQKELTHIGIFVGKITVGISAVLFAIGIFIQGRAFVDTLLFAVSVAVAAVPEGLPATITVALALGVQRLAKKNAIVKQLSSVETLGSTTVICSDKTGTLTKNEMTVCEIVMDKYEIRVGGVGYEPRGSFSIHAHGAHGGKEPVYFEYEKKDVAELAYKQAVFYGHFELLLRAASLCNNARLAHNEEQWTILGDPTEGALITLAEKAGFAVNNIMQKHARILELPFDSTRKRMSVIAEEKDTGSVFTYAKGAPDLLLLLCTHVMENGAAVPLTKEKREAFLKQNEFMAQRALRTIAVAYKTAGGIKKEVAEKDLVFLGLIGMIDPPREDVKEAVKVTHRAGIKVFIITGDYGITAHAIAKELGLAKSYGVNIVTGEMLDKMSDEALRQFVSSGQETIFARVSPEHKLRIVDTLKRNGEVVAVTGDGVNDAPALKRADIGVAMGITGTDVSKEAANMVLADDSFGTIVAAVIEGRAIYENMKKFIFYIFSSNIGELVAIFSGIAIGLPAPLTAIFILIINTLTDVFPALALGIEPVEKTIIEKPPRRPNSKIMEGSFIKRYAINGIWIGFVSIGVFVWNLWINGWRFGGTVSIDSTLYIQSSTMTFVVLTFLQMVHSWNSRSETLSIFRMRFFGNLHLLAAIFFSVIATIALVEIPFFQKYLKTTPLTIGQWMMLAALSFSILIFEESRKLWHLKTSRQKNG